ncbi:immunity 22 family protein [Flavobacterium sp. MXW15]|uniref:Immunity 22 family protein n=1 Tax=Xanthomonas chitinilytica TaxID=2989819 RepID=A0ABT3JXD6_9XANT|nr:immunity 22 family protein [Xanthomonas sp. H13-6]MCW4455312.1 immunity 22 family protein [Flavobacterium sp. MXW15]MCW4473139.1 immunity 22 family protein [Xanthomonas sp. H13-6]
MPDETRNIHVWVGSNFSQEEEYMSYFEIDHSTGGDFDDPSYKICGFCKDIGTVWYDEDFIGIIPRRDQEVSLDDILVEAAIDDDELPIAKARCDALGIRKANAIFWYQDADLELEKPIKENYNGLKYLGAFKES